MTFICIVFKTIRAFKHLWKNRDIEKKYLLKNMLS